MTSSNRSGIALSRSSSTTSNHSNTSNASNTSNTSYSSALSSDTSFSHYQLNNRNSNINRNNNNSNPNINNQRQNQNQNQQNHNHISSNNMNCNNSSSPSQQRASIASQTQLPQLRTSQIRGIPIQPQLLHGVQYVIHPSMPNTPLIVIPSNMVNLNTTTNTISSPPNQQNIIKTPPRNTNNTNTNINNSHNNNQTPLQSPNQNNNKTDANNRPNNHQNNQQLQQILEKKRNNITLSNEETAILQKAVQAAQQQFILWYQQQQLKQRVALNSAIANGILRLNAANNNTQQQQLTMQQLQAIQQLQAQRNSTNANNNNSNGTQLPQALNPSQIIAIQNHQSLLSAHQLQLQAHQQQLLQAQAQQRQQQILKAQQQAQAAQVNPNNNHSPWITTNHNAVSPINDGYAQNNIPSPYINNMATYTPPRNSSNSVNGNNIDVGYEYNGNMGYPQAHSLNMYHPKNDLIDTTDWKTYFALPVAEEFDKYFDGESKGETKEGELNDIDDLVSLIGFSDNDEGETKEDLSFNLELEGLGMFEFGEYAKQILGGNKSVLSHTLSSKLDDDKSVRQNLYQTLGVKDVSCSSCPWLVKDLIQCQTKLRSDSQLIKDKCPVFMRVDQTSIDQISKEEHIKKELIDKIINQITMNPIVPHTLLNPNIHAQCCSNHDVIEISNVDMSYVNIEVISSVEKRQNKFPTDWRDIVFPAIIDEEEERKKRMTVGFVDLCRTMVNSFDPTIDFVIKASPNGSYAVFHLVASELRQDGHHWEIPTVPIDTEDIYQMDANQRTGTQPIDRQLFGSKINHNNHESNRNHRNSTNQPQNNNNQPSQPSPWQQYATNATPNMNSAVNAHSMPTGYNPVQFINPNYIMPQQPIIYNNNNNNNNLNQFIPRLPSMNNNNNGNNGNNRNIPQNIQNIQRQSMMQRPQFQQAKMPNPTSWNVGGI